MSALQSVLLGLLLRGRISRDSFCQITRLSLGHIRRNLTHLSNLCWSFDARSWQFSTIRVYAAEGDPAQRYGVNILRSLTGTGSEHSVERAKQWIDDCVGHHDCSSVSVINNQLRGSFFPTRLVHIRASSPGPEDEVCLVNPAEAQSYVTLSYCWGIHDETPWNTTSRNLESRQAGFRIEGLPRTLHDAIKMTRRLGYDYLWVDALCILQDFLRDWEQQSAQMGLIYSNSCVTIAATSSTNVEEGFINTQSISQAQKIASIIRIPTGAIDGPQSVLYAFEWNDHGGGHNEENSPQQLREAPLSQRGWTFQESLFSPRTLHYASDQLFWECRQHYLAEDALHTQPFSTHYSSGNSISSRLKDLTLTPHGQTRFAVLWTWYTYVISAYTERVLTRSMDKLPAVSAIANFVHEVTGAAYLAGIWLPFIQFGLCWKVKRAATRPASYRCPSYSWAALDAVIDWPFPIFDNVPPAADFDVLAYKIDSSSSDPFGSVDCGYLDLFGRLRPARASPQLSETHNDNYSNAKLWQQSGDSWTRVEGVHESKATLDERTNGDDDSVDVQCFLLCSGQAELPGSTHWETYILLLQSTGKQNEYRRVGIATIFEEDRGQWFDNRSWQQFRLI